MHAKSQIATARRSLRWIAIAAGLWLLFLLALICWWGWVVYQQAVRIAELQAMLGVSNTLTQQHWLVTQRMVLWEGGTLVLLLTGLSVALLWLYMRDKRRTDAMHAFFASVTHELRTPLTSVRLQAESLAEAGKGSALAERLLEDTSRLEAQVEKTLELARIEGGGELVLQPLPIRAFLERHLQTLESRGTLRIALETSGDPDVLVLADRQALQIIFRNLAENTRRHSQAAPAEARVRVRNGADVTVDFSDDGRGFSGDVGRLGTLFYRGSQSQGAGVGLYLIQQLMQRMGGRAQFVVRPDRGFETHLHFQRAEEAA